MSNAPQQGPKKQHFVPRSHLAGFTDPNNNNRLHVYEKATGTVRMSRPENEGLERFTYMVEGVDGQVDKYSIENGLAKIEGRTMPLLRQMISDDARLTEDERRLVSFFLGMMILRNPLTMRNVEVIHEIMTKEKAKRDAQDTEFLEQILSDSNAFEDTGIPLGEQVKMLQTVMSEGHFEIKYPKGFATQMNDLSIRFAESLFRMRWCILRTKSDFFVTSDNPVFYGRVDPATQQEIYGGLENSDAFVTFPLARSAALIADWKEPASVWIGKATSNDLLQVNRRTIGIARKYVYAPHNSNRIKKLIASHRNIDVALNPNQPGVIAETIIRRRLDEMEKQDRKGT